MSALDEKSGVHAERMDQIYRYQRHIYDASRKYYLLGRDKAIQSLTPPLDGSVLEIGCGTARNLVAIARRFPRSIVFGVDISPVMLGVAQKRIAREYLSARVFLGQGDATCLDTPQLFHRDRFDRILFSYALSMIPDWQGAVRQAAALLAPGGRLTIVDFGDQGSLPGWFRTGLRKWLARFDVTPRDELVDWLGRMAAELHLELQCESQLRGYALVINATRKLDETPQTDTALSSKAAELAS